MQAGTVPLAGFRGLRAEILVALKKSQPRTARELAEQFDVTPNALRRHLKALEEGGLVHYRREVRGVGGPVYAYSLSEAGEALFPRAYGSALTEALEAVRAQQGAEGLVQLFRRQWARRADAVRDELMTLPLAERARRLAEMLTAQGYMAEAGEAGPASPNAMRIREHNCALHEAAARFPEICEAEREFLAEALDAEVERTTRIPDGCACCEYVVKP